jgi:hypothetical protein
MTIPTTRVPVWTPRTPDERRRVGVAALVAQVMSQPEGHRYAAAYGVLAGLVTSRTETMSTTWARDFARQIETAMTGHPFDRRGSTS